MMYKSCMVFPSLVVGEPKLPRGCHLRGYFSQIIRLATIINAPNRDMRNPRTRCEVSPVAALAANRSDIRCPLRVTITPSASNIILYACRMVSCYPSLVVGEPKLPRVVVNECGVCHRNNRSDCIRNSKNLQQRR